MYRNYIYKSNCQSTLALQSVVYKKGNVFDSARWILYTKVARKKVALSLLSLWLWSYGSWIHVFLYLCNQCLSPLKLWFRIPFMANKSSCVVLDTTLLCDKVCQWLKLATAQVIGFYRVLGFPLPNRGIQLKATISLKSRWKWHYILNTI